MILIMKEGVRIRILRKLRVEPIVEESYQVLIASLKVLLTYADDITSLINWRAPILPNLSELEEDELSLIKSDIERTNLTIRESQIKVQKLIPPGFRKRYAAYYTIDKASKLMALITKEFPQLRKNIDGIVLADPFLGSGLTLTTAINEVGPERISKVWGIEPLSLPALVAYAALLDSMQGKKDNITVIVGDAFKEIPKRLSLLLNDLPRADVILTNPPFTRWKNLDEKYREYLISIIEKLGYKKYISRKDANLQILSMFLCDSILNENGLLISVLPASTFYATYGTGYKYFLKENYEIRALIENDSDASFSENSGFKEVILVTIKKRNKTPTMFIRFNDNIDDIAKAVIHNLGQYLSFNLYEIPHFLDSNWLALFEKDELRNIIVNIFKQGLNNGTLRYWSDTSRIQIIRGIEMYGPQFFFIPNKYWIAKEKDNSVILQGQGKNLNISKEFLIRALRKPSFYSNKIKTNVNTFMLSIPPIDFNKLPSDLQEYIKWGIESGTAKPAINSYGKYWYSHVHKQVISKKPFGHVFIPDKVDLLFRNRGVFANYTDKEVAASKNFYIIKNMDENTSKLLVGWFNSTIFISILILMGRKISNTWTRFLENDYLKLPMMNTNANKEAALDIISVIEKILDKPLPLLWEQIGKDYRYDLDLAIAKFIGLDNPKEEIEELYEILNNLSLQFI